jgi:hypothetical protein
LEIYGKETRVSVNGMPHCDRNSKEEGTTLIGSETVKKNEEKQNIDIFIQLCASCGCNLLCMNLQMTPTDPSPYQLYKPVAKP